MEHNGIQYQVVQTANPTDFKWTVQLDENKTRTGVSFSRGDAILSAMRFIDRAIREQPKEAKAR
jgi:hypothetical protein